MAKRLRELDSNDKTTDTTEYNTVFVDTSLDTHLAMLVCNSDTVSDFKKKLVAEHMQCFPKIGEIQILSLKVKRRGNFYHLPDIMLVWRAFHGVKRNWFLSADASDTPASHLNLTSSELGTSNGVKMDTRNVDDNCRCLSSDGNRTETLQPSLPDDVTEKNVVPEMIDGLTVEKHLEKTIDFRGNNYTEENHVGTEFCAKKKRKMRHTEDVCHYPSLKESFTLSHASGKDTSIPKIVVCNNSTVDAVKEGPEGMTLYEQQGKPTVPEAIAQVSGVRNDQSDIEDRVAFEGTSADGTAEKSKSGSTADSQNLLGSEGRKEDTMLESTIPENLMASKLQSVLSQDGPTEHSGAVSIKVPDLPAGLMDADGATGDVNSGRNKKKKKKVQKTAAKIQGTTDAEQTRKGESIKPYTETHKSEKQEEEKSLSPNHDHEVIMPSNSKASDHVDPDLALTEARFSQHLLDANAITEPEISIGSMKKNKKKKREKKSADTNLERSGIEQTDNGISGSSSLLCPSTNHLPEETAKVESISDHKEKDVQMKLLDSSIKDASEEGLGANRKEADFVTLPQTKQTLKDVITGDKKERKTKSSAGSCLADFPAVEKEKKIVELNHMEKDGEDAENKDKKAKKKKKKRELTASGFQEQLLPVQDQKGGVEVLTADENLISVINSEQEGRHVASSQLVSPKSEEKLEDMHGSALNTDDPARTSENDGEGINFKQHIVPGQYQDKVDSSDKVEKVTKSNEQIRTRKKVKVNSLPSVCISTESQKSLKSYENKGSEHKSHGMKDGGRRQGDSAQNSDWNKAIGKKRKKRELTASDVREHLPVHNQKVGVEILTADEDSSSFINSGQEGKHVASSQVLFRKSEEKPEDMHGSALNTTDLARTCENEGEGINFKQYFVPGQYQYKVDSGDKVEKVTKSNEEIKTQKKFKVNVLPSLSISTEIQNPLKSYESKGSENKSHVRKDGGRRQEDSAQNSDLNEVIPNSSRGSLRISENGVKYSSSSEVKNPSLDKSSLGRSKTFPEKKGNKRSQSGLNVTDKMVMKTPQKKIVLTKPGGIFQASSGESSADENGTSHSDASTHTPSDSSSLSGSSVGESDLSQDSTRNGSNDANERSTGSKNMSKLDLSAAKDVTMDMILKSSKRFKKAKLQASQNELDDGQQMEFVPDGQPIKP